MHAANLGYLTTHEKFLLVLLRSRPDTVRGFSLHKTQIRTDACTHYKTVIFK